VWIDRIKPAMLDEAIAALENGDAPEAVFGPKATVIRYDDLKAADRPKGSATLKLVYSGEGPRDVYKVAFATEDDCRDAFDALAGRLGPHWETGRMGGGGRKKVRAELGGGAFVLLIIILLLIASQAHKGTGGLKGKLATLAKIFQAIGPTASAVVLGVAALGTIGYMVYVVMNMPPGLTYTIRPIGRSRGLR
jgi:hypothetical protein